MKIEFTNSGEIIEFENNKEVVDYMRDSAPHLESENNHQYMMGYARRAVISSNTDIDATNENKFVADLLKVGHIKLLET